MKRATRSDSALGFLVALMFAEMFSGHSILTAIFAAGILTVLALRDPQ